MNGKLSFQVNVQKKVIIKSLIWEESKELTDEELEKINLAMNNGVENWSSGRFNNTRPNDF